MATANGLQAKSPRKVSDKIRLEIVTYEGVVLDESVTEFTAPSTLGQFGVLPGHLPLLAALRTGVVTYQRDTESVGCAVGSGFVEVADDHAVVLTDKYCDKESIDIVQTRLQWKELQHKLETSRDDPNDPAFLSLVSQEQWLAAVLELYGDPPPPTLLPEISNGISTNGVSEEAGDDALKVFANSPTVDVEPSRK